MTLNRNEARLGVSETPDAAPPVGETPMVAHGELSFVVPTEIVDLPSKGRFYPEGHYLHNISSVEIKYMTAKEEDLLVSQSLIKKGIVLDRLLESLLIDKRIKTNDLLIGDKNALIVAARITGYGSEYTTAVGCPACRERVDFSFDLEEAKIIDPDVTKISNVEEGPNNSFIAVLPKSGVRVEFRPLTGVDEQKVADTLNKRSKHQLGSNTLTEGLRRMIVSVNGDDNPSMINKFINVMPAYDSKFLRGAYVKCVPNIDLTQNFLCDKCDHEQEMEVPLSADFFWPK